MKKKIRPSHKYTYLTFFILFVALTFLFWAFFGTKPWLYDYKNYWSEMFYREAIAIGVAFFICFIGAFIYQLKVYYLVDDKKIVRFGTKEREYYFNDIVYVDHEYTNKHIDMLIYLSTGRWVNLTMDKKKELLEIVQKKCHLLDKDAFTLKYPDAINRK